VGAKAAAVTQGNNMKVVLAAALAFAAGGAAMPLYHVAGTAHGPNGSYDYVSVDATLGRVYIGREFGVETFDLARHRFRTLVARKGVAAVLPIGPRLMLSTNGDENSATLFDRRTGHVVADIPTGEEPDGAYHDAPSGLAFVMNGGSRDVTVIDVARTRAVATIPADGEPEGAVGDGKGRLFVNLKDRNAIAVIDIARRKVIGRYGLSDCLGPTGISYDAAADLLITVCRNHIAKLTDASDGADRGNITIGSGADGVLFDPGRRLGFVPCIDGTLTVFRLGRDGRAIVTQIVKTRVGARTAAYDTRRDALYLPAAIVERDAAGTYVGATRDFTLLTVTRR
jgi:YVTN family beta-propeller protein